jgi:hypothetical protein
VFYLRNVYWFNPNWEIEKVPNGVYNVYLRHAGGVYDAEVKFFLKKSSTEEAEIGRVNPFNGNIPIDNNGNNLTNTYVATLDLSSYEDKILDLRIEIFKQGYTSNYYIEGAILVPISSSPDADAPCYFIINKDKHLNYDNVNRLRSKELLTAVNPDNLILDEEEKLASPTRQKSEKQENRDDDEDEEDDYY